MTTDLKSGRIMCPAHIYIIIIVIMESMSLTVAVLGNGNCTAWRQQETNAMFLSRDTSHYLFTPWSTFLPEKLTGYQLVTKFPAFYGTQRFNTAFTRARRSSQFNHPNNIGWRVQISKLTWFSPLPCYLFPPRPKHDTTHTLPNFVLLPIVSKF
jgi:hypothetical protein